MIIDLRSDFRNVPLSRQAYFVQVLNALMRTVIDTYMFENKVTLIVEFRVSLECILIGNPHSLLFTRDINKIHIKLANYIKDHQMNQTQINNQ